MVRAVDGMTKEKDAIFLSFLITIVFFQVATVGCGFIVMDVEAAWAACCIVLIGGFYWYKYCLRIFNRFKVSKYNYN